MKISNCTAGNSIIRMEYFLEILNQDVKHAGNL